jgi:cobalt-precorrin 5A hydrolase/precorrin-3B C17-methyltransferase
MINVISSLPEMDQLGNPLGWRQGTGDWAGVGAAIREALAKLSTGLSTGIARADSVRVIQEAGSTQWQAALPDPHSFQLGFPELTAERGEARSIPKARVWISPIQRRFADNSDLPKVQGHPRVLWIGVGCGRGTPEIAIAHAIQQALQAHHWAEGAIAGLATIDHKADEVGLVNYCRDRSLPLKCFSSEVLRAIAVPNPSTHVHSKVGTPSVAEAAAILAALECSSPPSAPCTPQPLLVSKQIFRLPNHPGAVTIAIAQAEQEYTDPVRVD